MVHAGTNGAYDDVPVENVIEAAKKTMALLHSENRKEMTELNKGSAKVEGDIADLIMKVAGQVAKDMTGEEE